MKQAQVREDLAHYARVLSTVAMNRGRSSQRGHASTSIPKTRRISVGQAH